jgi:fructosamine-3-kinase
MISNQKKIEAITGSKIKSAHSLSGGCISNAYLIQLDSGEKLFLKENSTGDMFLKEANGLNELHKTGSIKVPAVKAVDKDFILLEYITGGRNKKNFFEDFGRNFARLHRNYGRTYGFYEDNYIGSTIQINIPDEEEKNNWINFYFNKRLLFQFKLAEKKGHSTFELKDSFKKLEGRIESILSGSENHASLLHGDLWSGNFMADENGDAVIIDPAVYYGNREADLAMTKLFGGFSSEFYSAYNKEYPLPDGYSYRENIYKLYHVMNHLNLFGGGYYSQALSIIKKYC